MTRQEWTVRAVVNGETVGWSYGDVKDAKRAWSHMSRKRETIDTGDPIETASVRLPNGHLFYLGESVRWR